MKKFFLIISTVFLFSNCAMHGGYTTNSAALSTYNFSYARTSVEGTAKAFYVLGIGGLSRQALVEEARKNLMENHALQDNQAFVNITVSYKVTFVLPFFIQNKCTMSASVVQFNER